MHPMMFAGGVLHLTVVAVVAFFIWFAASKASGWIRAFGMFLGAWLVLLGILGLALAAHMGGRGMDFHHMHGWGGPAGQTAPAAPAPAPPAAP